VLYRNNGNGTFTDVTRPAGLFTTAGRQLGAVFGDYDNDGDLDIYCTNGHVTDNVELYDPQLSYRQKDLLYENSGGRFKDFHKTKTMIYQEPCSVQGADEKKMPRLLEIIWRCRLRQRSVRCNCLIAGQASSQPRL
jgi:hypothetical protein